MQMKQAFLSKNNTYKKKNIFIKSPLFKYTPVQVSDKRINSKFCIAADKVQRETQMQRRKL